MSIANCAGQRFEPRMISRHMNRLFIMMNHLQVSHGDDEEIQPGEGDRVQHVSVLPQVCLQEPRARPRTGAETELLFRCQARQRSLHGAGQYNSSVPSKTTGHTL